MEDNWFIEEEHLEKTMEEKPSAEKDSAEAEEPLEEKDTVEVPVEFSGVDTLDEYNILTDKEKLKYGI